MPKLNASQATRWIAKPVVFLLCLLPAVWLLVAVADLTGLAHLPAASLGANPIEKIQDTLGIWGLRMLLTTLAVTPLRELLGWPRLLGFRRMLGLFAFFYISMHFLFYLFVDQSLDWRVLVEDVAKRPFITAGFSALLLLIPLAVTSTKRAMRRLGRRWQRLHRLIYPAAILGCTHFFWQVKADIREPLVYILVLGALLGWRLYRSRRLAGRGRTEQNARQDQQATRAGLPVEPLPE
jgi:methionine sulfoxide reductase heme-binding subunit